MKQLINLTQQVERRTSAYSRLITQEQPETQIHVIPSGFVDQFFIITESGEDDNFSCQRVFKSLLPAILGTDEVTVEEIVSMAKNDLEVLNDKAQRYDELEPTLEKD